MESYVSVSQVNNYIKNIFDSEEMLQNISMFGEVGTFNISNNYAYFNLKDENAVISCVLFNTKNVELPKVGDKVIVFGGLNYYVKGGRLSFNVRSIMPYGKGLLYEKFLQLKEKLQSLGYFDEKNKKPIPQFVKSIGVVSSPTGAVIQDIIDVTKRRNNCVNIKLFPVKVQGVGAENEIVKGINFFSQNKCVDVIIVARGGGSQEDLEPFNTQIVADAVHNSSVPIVSAVGHETDYTIIDFVADLRAPTPSAGAELAVSSKSSIFEKLQNYSNYIYSNIQNKFENYNKELIIVKKNLFTNLNFEIKRLLNNLHNLTIKLLNVYEYYLNNRQMEIMSVNKNLQALNPNRILEMGYSKILYNDKAVTGIDGLKVGDTLDLLLKNGKIKSNIQKIERK